MGGAILTMSKEFFEKARELMEAGEMPDRVANKLLWAQGAELYALLIVINGTQKLHDKRINRLETIAKIIWLPILAVALKAFGMV